MNFRMTDYLGNCSVNLQRVREREHECLGSLGMMSSNSKQNFGWSEVQHLARMSTQRNDIIVVYKKLWNTANLLLAG